MIELHSSDCDPCPGRAQLRKAGHFDGRAGTALVRGLLAHSALELLHRDDGSSGLTSILEEAASRTLEGLANEGREPSESVSTNLPIIVKDVMAVLERYRSRILPITARMTLIGVEIPVFWPLSESVAFSSHVDALFTDEEGRVVIWDWKWRKDQLSFSDLSRNLQLAAYFGVALDGLFCLPLLPPGWVENSEAEEGVWCSPDGEMPTPLVSWVDLPSLKPYMRKTIVDDLEYKKGDGRPINRIIRTVNHHPGILDKIKHALIQRAELLTGEPVYIPQGCAHCECEPWCPRFDMFETTVKGSSNG